MKSILKYTIILATFGLVFTLTACQEDALTASPKGVLAEGVLSATTVDKLVVAAYQSLGAHFFGNDEAFAGPASNWIIDVRSDDAYKGGGGIADRTDIHQLETATFDPTNYAVAQKWRNPMFSIARCNLALREIANLEDPTYQKNTRTAEMRLLRGHFHFDLKRNFNNIPYLDENADPTATSNVALSSDEVWGKIEEDLLFAYENLPPEHDEVGRVTRGAAAGYLAKLYTYTGEWDKVLQFSDAVIQLGRYELLDDFQQLSTVEFENGPESVWTVQFSTANIFANHDWSNLLNITRGPGIDAGGYANGDDFYLASQNLVNAYRTDADGLPLFDDFNDTDVLNSSYSGNLDPRLDFSFGRIGIPWKGTALYSEAWVRSPDYFPGFSSKKQVVAPDDPNVHTSFPWAASGLNFNIIRYAEVLLWKAEALIELNQNLDEARALINEVRQRAKDSEYVKRLSGNSDAANYNIGLYTASGWTQDVARQALRFERRLELALEGHRYYDLLRWGILTQTINDYVKDEADNVSYLEGVTFTPNKHEYFPIPQREIDLAPDLYVQNEGY